MKRIYLYLIMAVLIVIDLSCLLIIEKMNECVPPAGCSDDDEKAGRCVKQHYPCSEF
jgi:hypothetical protein